MKFFCLSMYSDNKQPSWTEFACIVFFQNCTVQPHTSHLHTSHLHLKRTPTAPPAHLQCTSSTQLHLQCTPTAPLSTSNSTPPPPPLCTSNSAHPVHPKLIYISAPAPSSNSTAPLSTTSFTNPWLTIKTEVHLSAPQKCTSAGMHCAPPCTSAHLGTAFFK